ncbi:MAG: hypothetical protein ABS44_11900 [Chryseobacterium sp. SCN 40-13]|nr:MAG: hypothetical protein ABS44_11900 [Chryseobacterium sp. SCN 40-13]
MAKKIRQLQVEQLVEDLAALNNKKVASIAFSGTTTKTLTITFTDGTTVSSTFTDLNTTYPALTEALLNAGTSTTDSVISAKVLADYINSRLSAVYTWKASVAFAGLPTTGQKVGDVYNITNAFTLGGENYPAGTNVAWNGTGWDPLAGFLDTSIFLTAETDPKGVKSIAITGGATKTVAITLRDDTVISGTFADIDTTYTKGTLAQLNAGTDTTGQVWAAKDISDFVKALQIVVKHEVTAVTAGMIVSGKVTITPSTTITDKTRVMVFLNGVKQPLSAYAIVAAKIELTQASLATPVIATDEIEIFYI